MNGLLRNISSVFLLIFCINSLFAQYNPDNIYVAYDTGFKATFKGIGIDSINFKVEKIGHSEITYYSILCRSTLDICNLHFKSDSANNWYYCMDKHLTKFYDSKNNKILDVEVIKDSLYLIEKIKKCINDTIELIGFGLRYIILRTSHNNIIYWFHNQLGIVAISMNGLVYIRRDCFYLIE